MTKTCRNGPNDPFYPCLGLELKVLITIGKVPVLASEMEYGPDRSRFSQSIKVIKSLMEVKESCNLF